MIPNGSTQVLGISIHRYFDLSLAIFRQDYRGSLPTIEFFLNGLP